MIYIGEGVERTRGNFLLERESQSDRASVFRFVVDVVVDVVDVDVAVRVERCGATCP